MIRKLSQLLASTILVMGAGAANAAPFQGIFFHGADAAANVPGGFASSRPSPSSMFPSLRVELPTLDSQLCISPCVPGISPYLSPLSANRQRAGWVPGTHSFRQADWSPWPAAGTPGTGFDPLVFPADLFGGGPGGVNPVEVTTSGEQPFPLPPAGDSDQSVIGVPFASQITGGDQPPAGFFNLASHCEGGDASDQACIQGAVINTAVPLPSTLLLMAVGALGLCRLRRRQV